MAFHDPRTPVLKIENDRDLFIKGIVGHCDIYVTTPRQSMEHPFHSQVQRQAEGEFGCHSSVHNVVYKDRSHRTNNVHQVWMRAWVISTILLLTTLTIAVCRRNHYVSVRARIQQYNLWKFYHKSIRGGNGDGGDDLIDSDGVIGNPIKYPALKCALPNYLSKKGRIVAVSANGTEVPINIKSVNWFGIETYVLAAWSLSSDVATRVYHTVS